LLLTICLRNAATEEEIRALFSQHCIEITCNGDLETVELELGLRDERTTPKPNYFDLEQVEKQLFMDTLGIDDTVSLDDTPEADDIYAIIDHFLMQYGSDASILDVSGLDGFFAALACAPNFVMPSR